MSHPVIVWPTWVPPKSQRLFRDPGHDVPEVVAEAELGDASAHHSIVFQATQFRPIRVTSGAFDDSVSAAEEPDSASQYIGHFRPTVFRRAQPTVGAFDDSVTPEPDTDQRFPGKFTPTRLRRTQPTIGAFDEDGPAVTPELGDASAHQVFGFFSPKFRKTRTTDGAFDDSFVAPVEPEAGQSVTGRFRPAVFRRLRHLDVGAPYVEYTVTDDSGVTLSEELTVEYGDSYLGQGVRKRFRVTKFHRISASPPPADDSTPPEPDSDQFHQGKFTPPKFLKTRTTDGAFDESVTQEPDTDQPFKGKYHPGSFLRTRPTDGAFDESFEELESPVSHVGEFRPPVFRRLRYLSPGAFDESVQPEPDTDQFFQGKFHPTRLHKIQPTDGAFDESVTPEPDTDQPWRGCFKPTRLRRTMVTVGAFDEDGPSGVVPPIVPPASANKGNDGWIYLLHRRRLRSNRYVR